VEAQFDVTAKVDEKTGERVSADTVRQVDPALIDPNPHQPRTNFDPDALEALAASIRVHGILQPMVATQKGSRYELIAGERRLRAAKLAGLETVPLIVRSFDEQEKLELAILENIQREELNPLELATAYRKLTDEFNLSLSEIGRKVGRDKSTISNQMRLLRLPVEAKQALVDKKITEGHARVLLTGEDETEKMLELLRLMIKNQWNVRQAEEFARGYRGELGSKMRAQARINSVNQMTMALGDYLGTKVIQRRTAKGGRLIIEYYSEEELDRILKTIQHEG
jgi:ParB family chromosome partitioning protein